jgi:hypothetical protein
LQRVAFRVGEGFDDAAGGTGGHDVRVDEAVMVRGDLQSLQRHGLWVSVGDRRHIVVTAPRHRGGQDVLLQGTAMERHVFVLKIDAELLRAESLSGKPIARTTV